VTCRNSKMRQQTHSELLKCSEMLCFTRRPVPSIIATDICGRVNTEFRASLT
jgi:hypothetical protein